LLSVQSGVFGHDTARAGNSLRQSLGVMWRNRTNGIAIEADRKMDFPSLPRVEECAFSLF
jgi:hypothetical protein